MSVLSNVNIQMGRAWDTPISKEAHGRDICRVSDSKGVCLFLRNNKDSLLPISQKICNNVAHIFICRDVHMIGGISHIYKC